MQGEQVDRVANGEIVDEREGHLLDVEPVVTVGLRGTVAEVFRAPTIGNSRLFRPASSDSCFGCG